MSNPDSFIDEVTEEVRRDRLFKLMRRYGWIPVVIVLMIVGGAAFNEWQKAKARTAAEAAGDAILSALSGETAAESAARLAQIDAEGDAAVVRDLLAAVVEAEDNPEAAADRLRAIADSATLPALYHDLAVLKLAMLGGGVTTAQERVSMLEPLTAPGAPFRVLAEEQMAMAEIELGMTEAAVSRLQLLLADDEASQALRRRASQLIVALGGSPETS